MFNQGAFGLKGQNMSGSKVALIAASVGVYCQNADGDTGVITAPVSCIAHVWLIGGGGGGRGNNPAGGGGGGGACYGRFTLGQGQQLAYAVSSDTTKNLGNGSNGTDTFVTGPSGAELRATAGKGGTSTLGGLGGFASGAYIFAWQGGKGGDATGSVTGSGAGGTAGAPGGGNGGDGGPGQSGVGAGGGGGAANPGLPLGYFQTLIGPGAGYPGTGSGGGNSGILYGGGGGGSTDQNGTSGRRGAVLVILEGVP